MKVLSLKQPFAELVLQGKKKIELRKWNTYFRGEFLIHSSKVQNLEAMKKFGFTKLPCGFIVGKAKLIDVKKYDSKDEHIKDKPLHLASVVWGKYGFVLDGVKRVEPVLPCRGNLGFWNYKGDIKKIEVV